MITQEILDTFVFSTIGGEKFGVNDPMVHDEIIGYYPTKEAAETAFKEYVEKEGIIFVWPRQ
jgi:hypothetical protein